MKNTALILIDVQEGLDDPSKPRRNNPGAESVMRTVLDVWRADGRPVVHIRHCSIEPDSPLRPELPGNAIKKIVRPQEGEVEFTKQTNSAFVGTDLEAWLRGRGIQELVLMGLTTDHCVSATTRSASDLGFDVTLLADATAAFDTVGFDGKSYSAEMVHQVSLASLNGEFCQVRMSDAVLAASLN